MTLTFSRIIDFDDATNLFLKTSIFMRDSWHMPNMDWPNNFDITTSTLR
jgi:hypothetical protein